MSRTPSIFGDPGRIAPSVEKAWRDDFILELRLLSVPGDRIGDALMTVESHVAESGESAQEAFGEPKPYAREIAAATGTVDAGWTVGLATVISTVAGLVGMLVTVRAFVGWLDGGPVGVTTGELVGLGVLVALGAAVVFTPTLRIVVEHPWLAVLLPALVTGGFVGLFLLMADPVLTVPVAPVGAVGVLLLVLGAVVGWFDGPHEPDEITAPGQAPRGGPLGSRLPTALVMSLMTLLMLVLVWVQYAIAT